MLDRMFMGAAADDKLFVEDVFSTWLYTGTGAAQTITNGIDLAGKGGLVWIKARNAANNPGLYDTARGPRNVLRSNDTSAQYTASVGSDFASFNSNGFSVNGTTEYTDVNISGSTLASWTFREAPKFFDVVTWTGNSTYNRQIPHSLGVTPGFIIVKATSTTGNWVVYHRSSDGMYLNTTGAASSTLYPIFFGDGTNAVAPTATNFTIGGAGAVNGSGNTYVAYLFAHDTASDGIIQCGSYTGNGTANSLIATLGFEPQWLLVKRTDTTSDWIVVDVMRGAVAGGDVQNIYPNSSAAEVEVGSVAPGATGIMSGNTAAWGESNASGGTYIYVAIRRGPMRTPTLGTSVFNPITYTGNNTNGRVFSYANTPQIDLSITLNRFSYFGIPETIAWMDRLRGNGKWLNTQAANAESSIGLHFWQNSSTYQQSSNNPQTYNRNSNGDTFVGYGLTRAPKFFDVVCYTGGAGAAEHKLGVSVELIIAKNRTSSSDWAVWHTLFGQSSVKNLFLNTDAAAVTPAYVYLASASNTSHFWTSGSFNTAGQNYVAYLFASCAGVSKVGSYTGNGSSQTINCAFAAGARFVMIKRTDSTGDWYVWDTARGIVAGNDPALLLNLPSEYTGIDSVDPTAVGFIVNQDGTTNVNVNAATYIYLAIA